MNKGQKGVKILNFAYLEDVQKFYFSSYFDGVFL
jgi:hypothetical protein